MGLLAGKTRFSAVFAVLARQGNALPRFLSGGGCFCLCCGSSVGVTAGTSGADGSPNTLRRRKLRKAAAGISRVLTADQDKYYAGGIEKGMYENRAKQRPAFFVRVTHAHCQHEQGGPVPHILVHGGEDRRACRDGKPCRAAAAKVREERADGRLKHSPKEHLFENGHDDNCGNHDDGSDG